MRRGRETRLGGVEGRCSFVASKPDFTTPPIFRTSHPAGQEPPDPTFHRDCTTAPPSGQSWLFRHPQAIAGVERTAAQPMPQHCGQALAALQYAHFPQGKRSWSSIAMAAWRQPRCQRRPGTRRAQTGGLPPGKPPQCSKCSQRSQRGLLAYVVVIVLDGLGDGSSRFVQSLLWCGLACHDLFHGSLDGLTCFGEDPDQAARSNVVQGRHV